MHSIYFFSVVVFGFDIFMWKFASATLFSMLFQWLNELLSFTRFLISKLWWKWLSICGLNSKKNTKTATTSRLCISFTHSVNTNKSIILWFAFIKSHHWKWISLLAWRYFAALFSVNQNYRDQMIFSRNIREAMFWIISFFNTIAVHSIKYNSFRLIGNLRNEGTVKFLKLFFHLWNEINKRNSVKVIRVRAETV